MAYTDPTLNSNIKVKQVHITEAVSNLQSIITASKLSITIPTDYSNIKSVNIKSLQNAINSLETSFSGNCCQANCCQTCQSSKCQSCQSQCRCNCGTDSD